MTKLSSDYTKYGSNFSTVDISAFGILEGISETIVSTGLKCPNAAPIGIIVKDGRYYVRLFRGSHTWANVLKEGYMAANVIYNPLLFVRSTFFDLELFEFDYVTTHKLNFPILKEAAAWIIFKCINIMNTDQILVADLIPMDTGLNDVKKKIFWFQTEDSMQCLRPLFMQPATSSQVTKNTLN